MKNLNILMLLLLVILGVSSCDEEDNFKESNIQLVPVYSLTEVSGPNAPFKMNVYKDQLLYIEYATSSNAMKFVSDSYTDSSTETNFEITWEVTKTRTNPDNEDELQDYKVDYVLSGDKETGSGTLISTSSFPDGASTTETFTLLIADTEVYN